MDDTAPRPMVQLLVLDRIDDARNIARFYVLAIEPTLFAEVSLVREWGRLGANGRRRIELHPNQIAAKTALGKWLRKKMKKGYRLRPNAIEDLRMSAALTAPMCPVGAPAPAIAISRLCD
jgi:predicted DNA-binding WGR domain protein